MRGLREFAVIPALILAGCSAGTGASPDGENQSVAASSDNPLVPKIPILDCIGQARPDDRQDNDIVGIDLGMSADDALKIAKCNKEGFAVNVADDTSVTLPDGSHPRGGITLQKSDDRIDVFLAGLPGKEKVFALMRGKKFPEGAEPTMDQMRADLVKKYAPIAPDESTMTPDIDTQVQALTPDGQQISGSQLSSCTFTFGQNMGHNSLGQLHEECGFTKKFQMSAKSGNDALVREFSIWIGNQNEFFVEARRTIAAIQAMEARRREAERQKADSSNRVPEL